MEQETALALEKPLEPMEMIRVAFDAAIKQGAALEVVDRILEQQKWMIQHREEEEFNAALKRIQMKLKKIAKRGYNETTRSHFATAEDIDDAIQGLLDDEGMALSFVPKESANPEEVVIVGTLALGAYKREYPLPMPADGKGAKGGGVMSRTHATGSAITYGKRYLKNMIFDLRFQERDDDGNAAAGITQEAGSDWVSAIEGGGDPADTMRIWQQAVEAAKKAGPDYKAMTIFTEARDKRLKELKRSTHE